MAGRVLEVVGLAIVTMCALCSAQTPATVRPAMPNCPPAPISLSPCIGYVFGVGSATLSACCAQFQAFFQAQGPCLCAAAKLAPSPFGLVLGQAQAMIPNVCNLPSNPCDDVAGASTAPAASTPSVASTMSPATPLAPTAPSAQTTAPATTPVATPATPATTPSSAQADPDESEAPPAPADGSPAAVTAPGQVAPESAGPNAGSQKLPELLHSAGAPRSRGTAAGTVLITLFLACVSNMYV